jgi:phospholipid/cholesterol/gamma-HCH transport system permease protein
VGLPLTSPPSELTVSFASRLVSSLSPEGAFRTVGQFVVFTAQTLWQLPITVRRYRRQTLQAMNGLAWGRGSIIVDGGVISVLLILGIAIGASVAVEAFATLNLIGFGALSGIVGGLANVREMAPLVAGIAFASQAGCRMTAEIGAMRISEEIDATEAMGLRPIPFVVGTRLVGAMICVVPGFLMTLVVTTPSFGCFTTNPEAPTTTTSSSSCR